LFGPYYRGRISKRSSVEAGLLLGIGSQSAEVKGFTSPKPGNFPWTVLMPALGYRLSLGRTASAFAGMGPVIQIRPQSFSVALDTAGHTAQVAAPPSVGFMAEVGLALGGDIF